MSTSPHGDHERPATSIRRAGFQGWQPPSVLVIVLVLGILVSLDAARLKGEWRFFTAGTLIAADSSAPVPQDDRDDPAIDTAFRAAAAQLPTSATCVIDRSAWHRDYFRAAYLLMPRRVWPATPLPTSPAPGPASLAAVMRTYHASCLLLPAGQQAPSSLHLAGAGPYALYLLPIGAWSRASEGASHGMPLQQRSAQVRRAVLNASNQQLRHVPGGGTDSHSAEPHGKHLGDRV